MCLISTLACHASSERSTYISSYYSLDSRHQSHPKNMVKRTARPKLPSFSELSKLDDTLNEQHLQPLSEPRSDLTRSKLEVTQYRGNITPRRGQPLTRPLEIKAFREPEKFLGRIPTLPNQPHPNVEIAPHQIPPPSINAEHLTRNAPSKGPNPRPLTVGPYDERALDGHYGLQTQRLARWVFWPWAHAHLSRRQLRLWQELYLSLMRKIMARDAAQYGLRDLVEELQSEYGHLQ